MEDAPSSMYHADLILSSLLLQQLFWIFRKTLKNASSTLDKKWAKISTIEVPLPGMFLKNCQMTFFLSFVFFC